MIDIDKAIEYKIIEHPYNSICNFAHEYDVDVRCADFNFGAYINNDIVGVLTISCSKECCFIISFYIIPLFRSIGIGTKLLNVSYLHLFQKNLIVKCSATNIDINRFNSFLCKNNWEPLKYDYTLYVINRTTKINDNLKKLKLFDKEHIPSLNFYAVKGMSKKQLLDAERQANSIVDDYLKPFCDFKRIIPQLSFFVYDGPFIVGWLVTNSHGDGEAYVRCVFVKEAYRYMKLGLYLIYIICDNFINNNAFAYIKHLSFCFDKNNKKLHKFYKLICDGYILSEKDIFATSKKN